MSNQVQRDSVDFRVRQFAHEGKLFIINSCAVTSKQNIDFCCDTQIRSGKFLSLLKGLTSAYVLLSASVVHDRVWKVMVDGSDRTGPLFHGMTYCAHPAAAAGVAKLTLLDELQLVPNAKAMGSYLLSSLREEFAQHPFVGDIRGEGLMCAIELVSDRAVRKFFDPARKVASSVVGAMLDMGIISRAMPDSDVVGFAPPLCVSTSKIEAIVAVTRRALDKVFPSSQ